MGVRDYDDLCIRFNGVFMAFMAVYDIYDLVFRNMTDSMACYLYEYICLYFVGICVIYEVLWA